jgi:hypothetical protein
MHFLDILTLYNVLACSVEVPTELVGVFTVYFIMKFQISTFRLLSATDESPK